MQLDGVSLLSRVVDPIVGHSFGAERLGGAVDLDRAVIDSVRAVIPSLELNNN